MKSRLIYFDNAATSHPKPESVYQKLDSSLRRGGSPGRSAHALSLVSAQEVFETRLALASFLGISAPARLVFTPGCTYSLNMVLNGLGLKEGERVLVSALEHNAVMRPLHKLKQRFGIEIEALPYAPGSIIDLLQLQAVLAKRRPRLCVFAEASNVTGEMLDLEETTRLCRQFEVPVLIDAAQSAGVFHGKLNNCPVSYWAASGHKGLFGPPGLGLLYVAPGFDIEPLVHGGTGSHSEELDMPEAYPDRLEAGTMAGHLIAGLGAGVEFLETTGLDKIRSHELELSGMFIDWLIDNSRRFHLIAGKSVRRTALVSFQVRNMDTSLVAELLDRDYGICVRAGLHCAASAHRSLGSNKAGLVRVSFSYFNKKEELAELIRALENISCISGG